eukprot:419035_1
MSILEAGRIVFYPGSNTIDWVIIKAMDVSSCFVDDFFVCEVIAFGVLMCVWILLPKVHSIATSQGVINKTLQRDDYIKIMNQIKPMVQGAANIVWADAMKNESKGLAHKTRISTNIACT